MANLEKLDLTGTATTAAGLVQHLKGFTQLRSLVLGYSITSPHSMKLTDADLFHLKELTKLEVLWLSNGVAPAEPRISDAGLENLKGMANLKGLGLSCAQITDAGLVHLKGLTKLQALRIGGFGSEITNAGFADLQKALPDCKIEK